MPYISGKLTKFQARISKPKGPKLKKKPRETNSKTPKTSREKSQISTFTPKIPHHKPYPSHFPIQPQIRTPDWERRRGRKFKMKVKPVKLRESHKNSNNGKPSFCSVLWDNYSTHIVTSSSSDSSISIYDSLLLSTPSKNLRHHRDGVTALSLSPNSTCLASGSIDRTVKLYKFPSIFSLLLSFLFPIL